MSSSTLTRFQWARFLGAVNHDDAVDELRRLMRHLDHGCDSVNYVLQVMAGSPNGDAEETLRVARTAIHEAMDELESTIRRLRFLPPDAA